MYNLKTSAFGGYNKKQVNALISDLENKVNSLTANEKRLQIQLEEAHAKLSEDKSEELKAQNEILLEQNRMLSEKNARLEEENLKLQSDLAALKNAGLSNQNQMAANESRKSKNHMIKAYSSGYDIVQQSLTLSDNFFKDVQEIYKDAELSATKAIDEYQTVGEEIDALLSYINNHITSVRDETEDLILKAKAVSSMLSKIDTIKQNARLYARKKVNEYEQTAAEFIQRPNTESHTDDEPESVPAVPAESREEPESVSSAAEPESSAADAVQVEAAVPDQQPKPEAKNTESSFTQFGHKSRISSEERERLIKQVLTFKNKK